MMSRLQSLWRIFDPRNPQGDEIGGKVSNEWLGTLGRMIPWLRESREQIARPHQREIVTGQLPWIDETDVSNNGEYDYSTPYRSDTDSAESDLIKALSATAAFKRLADIRFLGALDYFLVAHPNGNSNNKRFTRLQHSLGVAALAKAYLDLKKRSPQQRMLCIAAAMLHDIGHPPFSHTLEPVFEELFGLDHHKASERIISGQTGLGEDVALVLRNFGIDPLAVLDVLSGGDDLFDDFFSGPINFDTIEGILRARNYLRMQRLGLSPIKVMHAAAVRGDPLCQQLVDDFWQSKHEIYALVIRSRLGVLYDGLFQAIARQSSSALAPTDFFVTETDIFSKIPLLREVLKKDRLKEIAKAVLPSKVAYQLRKFYIDDDVGFASHNDRRRYRQMKVPTFLTLRDILPA